MQGVYVKRNNDESLLGQLGHVLDEVPAEPPLEVAESNGHGADVQPTSTTEPTEANINDAERMTLAVSFG